MDDARLREYIERMVKAKEIMNAGRDELNDLRRESRSDGLNLQALNPLIDILSEHQTDKGKSVLTELYRYACVSGTELNVTDHVTASYTKFDSPV